MVLDHFKYSAVLNHPAFFSYATIVSITMHYQYLVSYDKFRFHMDSEEGKIFLRAQCWAVILDFMMTRHVTLQLYETKRCK